MVNTRRHAAQIGVAKPDFLRCVAADQILIENAERFAGIDLDLSDFEKECTQYICHIHRRRQTDAQHRPVANVQYRRTLNCRFHNRSDTNSVCVGG